MLEEKCKEIGVKAKLPQLFQIVKKHLLEKSSFSLSNTDGFLIVRPLIINDKNTLQVEVAFCNSGKGYLQYQKLIEKLAAYLDCTQIEFYTVRNGFNRLAPRLGYEKQPGTKHFILWRKLL